MANESYYTRQLRKELDKIGLFRKIATGMQSAGISDLLGCVKGRYVAIEAKIRPNQATPLQQMFLTEVSQNGGLAVLAEYDKGKDGWFLLDWTTGARTIQMTKNEVAEWVSKQSSSLSTQLT
jgi:Holliday junction resolvase